MASAIKIVNDDQESQIAEQLVADCASANLYIKTSVSFNTKYQMFSYTLNQAGEKFNVMILQLTGY